MDPDDRTKPPVVSIERGSFDVLTHDYQHAEMDFMVRVEGEYIKTVHVRGRIPDGAVTAPQYDAVTTPALKLDALRYWYYLPKLGKVVRDLYIAGGIDAVDLMPLTYDWRDEPLPEDLTFPQPDHKNLWIGRR